MDKNILNKILIGIIALMSLSICVLVVCILTRPRYVNTSEESAAVIIEVPPDASISLASAKTQASRMRQIHRLRTRPRIQIF